MTPPQHLACQVNQSRAQPCGSQDRGRRRFVQLRAVGLTIQQVVLQTPWWLLHSGFEFRWIDTLSPLDSRKQPTRRIINGLAGITAIGDRLSGRKEAAPRLPTIIALVTSNFTRSAWFRHGPSPMPIGTFNRLTSDSGTHSRSGMRLFVRRILNPAKTEHRRSVAGLLP